MADVMSMQTLTAYKYNINIIDKNSKDTLTIGDGTNNTIDFCKVLLDFANYMTKTQRSNNAQKVLSLCLTNETKSQFANTRVHFKATSGRYGQRTVAVNINDENDRMELGTEKAICHFYNVFFYIEYNTTENICIFHRYGRGGCKTIFLELFSKFLYEKDMRIEMSALVSPEQQNNIVNGQKTKLRLLRNTVKIKESTDVVDNIQIPKKTTNNTEMELSINLRNRNMSGNIGQINDIIFGRKKVSEVFEIPNNFEYDQAKVEMRIGNQTQTIDLNDLGRILCEFDITNQLDFDEDNEPIYETISKEADAYYDIQKKRMR